MLRISDYPQLRLIAWNRAADDYLEEREAFGLYEENWRFIDTEQLASSERALIERLTEEYGGGILNV